ncbi:hypothetical protein N2152v2_002741 [Parachlorella kessleri]
MEVPNAAQAPTNPQFAHPSKVIHVRNLPFDVSDDEIRDLCVPWGQVVAVKSKLRPVQQVGANKNQAFVEMAHIQQSMALVGHYQHSAEPAKIVTLGHCQHSVEPAKVRGRPAYLNYSGRDRLTNLTSTDIPTPVLHVQINDIVPELYSSITLDLLNVVFGAFGYVTKAVTYPTPEGGLVAWLQFADAGTALQVRDTLQGQQIPRHLLGDHPTPPTFHLTFSPHTDLQVTAQSSCTRDFGNPSLRGARLIPNLVASLLPPGGWDFSNPSLPWGDVDANLVASLVPLGEVSNVITINFDSATYPVTLDGVHTICSTYGFVQKIHIFEREGKTVALVQYPDPQTAQVAKQGLEGHPMYDGGHNVMRPVYSKHRNLVIRPGERSRDYTTSAQQQLLPGPAGMALPAQQAQQQAQQLQHGMGVSSMAGTAPGGLVGGMLRPSDSAGMAGAAGVAPQQGQHAQQQGQPYQSASAPAAEGGGGGSGGPPAAEQAQQQAPPVVVTGEDYVQAHEAVLRYLPYQPATMARSPVIPPQPQQAQQQQAQQQRQQPLQQPGLPQGQPAAPQGYGGVSAPHAAANGPLPPFNPAPRPPLPGSSTNVGPPGRPLGDHYHQHHQQQQHLPPGPVRPLFAGPGGPMRPPVVGGGGGGYY